MHGSHFKSQSGLLRKAVSLKQALTNQCDQLQFLQMCVSKYLQRTKLTRQWNMRNRVITMILTITITTMIVIKILGDMLIE
eukprot:6281098-Amphidinium_carterae.1